MLFKTMKYLTCSEQTTIMLSVIPIPPIRNTQPNGILYCGIKNLKYTTRGVQFVIIIGYP